MTEFRIHSKLWEGERCKFKEVLEKCQNYKFYDIFWDILDKIKGNLGQECVNFQGKTRTIAGDFPGKMTVFQFWSYLTTFPP